MGLFNWANLGKERSDFGRWADKKGLSQTDIVNMTGVGKTIVSKLCNDDRYVPKFSTIAKLKSGFTRNGINFDDRKFW